MVKVSIEVHDGTARFVVAVPARSIQQAQSILATPYSGNAVRVKSPIY
jgi:hypothetical protein